MISYIRLQKLTGIVITDHETFAFHNHVTDNCGAIIMKSMEIKSLTEISVYALLQDVPVRACPWMRELCVGWHSTFLEDLK
jgi:hypothetical protein